MSGQLLIRDGTAAQHTTFTGARDTTNGGSEITVDTTNNAVVVHNGATPGGNRMMSVAEFSTQITTWLNSLPTTLPGSAGQWWVNGGVLSKS